MCVPNYTLLDLILVFRNVKAVKYQYAQLSFF